MKYNLIKAKNNLNVIHQIISKNLKDSVFKKLGQNFLKDLVKRKKIHVYCVKNKSRITAIITVINSKDYLSINKSVIKYLFYNPTKLIFNFFYLLNSLKKTSKVIIKKDYLHLLHLIIIKKDFLKVSLKKKDMIFNKFYKTILKKHKSKVLFLCFDKKNKKAHRYYLRNNFKRIYRINNIIYFKKEFKF